MAKIVKKEVPKKFNFRIISGKYCLGDAENLFEESEAKKVLKELNRRVKKINCDYCEKFNLYFFRIINTDVLFEYINNDTTLKISSKILILTKNPKDGKLKGCHRFVAKSDFTIKADYLDDSCFLYFNEDDSPSPFQMWGEDIEKPGG